MFQPLNQDDKYCVLWPTTKRFIQCGSARNVYSILCIVSDLFRAALFVTILVHIDDAILITYILIFNMIAVLTAYCYILCCSSIDVCGELDKAHVSNPVSNPMNPRSQDKGAALVVLIPALMVMVAPCWTFYDMFIGSTFRGAACNELMLQIFEYTLNAENYKEKCRRIITCNYYLACLFQHSMNSINGNQKATELMDAVIALQHESMNTRNCLTSLDVIKPTHFRQILRCHIIDGLAASYCLLYALQCVLCGFLLTQNEIIWIFCGVYVFVEVICYCYHAWYLKLWIYALCVMNVPVVTGQWDQPQWLEFDRKITGYDATKWHEMSSIHMNNIEIVHELIFDQIDCVQMISQQVNDLDDNLSLMIAQFVYTPLPVIKKWMLDDLEKALLSERGQTN